MFVTVKASMTVCVQVKWSKKEEDKGTFLGVHFMIQYHIESTLLDIVKKGAKRRRSCL